MTQKMYRMGMDVVPESGLKHWHQERGMPWGPLYDEGPDPVTIRAMSRPVLENISVHLANEHGLKPAPHEEEQVQHMFAHLYAMFRSGQGHYHRKPPSRM